MFLIFRLLLQLPLHAVLLILLGRFTPLGRWTFSVLLAMHFIGKLKLLHPLQLIILFLACAATKAKYHFLDFIIFPNLFITSLLPMILLAEPFITISSFTTIPWPWLLLARELIIQLIRVVVLLTHMSCMVNSSIKLALFFLSLTMIPYTLSSTFMTLSMQLIIVWVDITGKTQTILLIIIPWICFRASFISLTLLFLFINKPLRGLLICLLISTSPSHFTLIKIVTDDAITFLMPL